MQTEPEQPACHHVWFDQHFIFSFENRNHSYSARASYSINHFVFLLHLACFYHTMRHNEWECTRTILSMPLHFYYLSVIFIY